MNKPKKKSMKKQTTSIQVSYEFRAILDEIAEKEGRSMSGLIRKLLMEALEARNLPE